MSDRFFVAGPLGVGEVEVDGPEAHHMLHVRRFQQGEAVTLFNGDGHEYHGRIVSLHKKNLVVAVEQRATPVRELPFALHLAAALPKADRTDFLIEKLTELGVTSFTPLHTERSVVKADVSKVEKLQRAVIEASKQCGRNTLMVVHPPAGWRDWLTVPQGDRWLAHTATAPLLVLPEGATSATIAIGPEGGFSPLEVEQAQAAGWHLASLGPRILRIETAALAAATRCALG